MTAVKRRVNSTGRKRIPLERVKIRLFKTEPGQPLRVSVALQLSGLGFPASAVVAIDAYHKSTSMRFDCGTVDHLVIPPVLELTEISNRGAILFRVKVIDRELVPGRLLGAAERIRPKEANEEDGKRSILPIVERDIGAEVWKIEFPDGGGPQLILNNRVPGISARLLASPLARGLLLPAAFRLVLQAIVAEPSVNDDPEELDWKEDWVQFMQNRLGFPESLDALPKSDEDKSEWVDDVVRAFCEKQDFLTPINLSFAEESSDA